MLFQALFLLNMLRDMPLSAWANQLASAASGNWS